MKEKKSGALSSNLICKNIFMSTAALVVLSLHCSGFSQKLPELPTISNKQPLTNKLDPTEKKHENLFKGKNSTAKIDEKVASKEKDVKVKADEKAASKEKDLKTKVEAKKIEEAPAEKVPQGKELVSIDFPNGVNLGDIIKTVGIWTGKNFVLGQGVSGGAKISIISPEPVTKEEAYQAFLSALNISGFTTVETGKIVKILPVANAKSSNIKTYYGENWAPATDEIINHVVPLHYIDVMSVVSQLRPLLGLTQYAQFTTTNSLILTDTGNRIRRILEVIKLLDDKTSQSQVSIVPVNYTDAKDIANKVIDIFGSRSGPSISLQKALVDDRTNSVILVGPAHALDDIVRFIQRMDKPAMDQSSQALIRVRPLDYADAEKLAATLQALTQNTNVNRSGMGSQKPPYLPSVPSSSQQAMSGYQSATPTAADISGSKVTADKSTNSLIIEASKSAFDELDLIISQLDKRRAQVYIEANIIDLSEGNNLLWTPAALGGGTSANGNVTIPFGFNIPSAALFTSNSATSSTSAATAFQGLGNNAMLGVLSNKTVSIGGFDLTPGALIFALKTDANSNVLQTPSMMVSDNETANFQAADEYNSVLQIPNPAANSGTVAQPQRYDVTTSLKVTPQISRADYVNLKINMQLDDAQPPGPGQTYPSPIHKRSAESVVTVQNGQSAVLGGITKNSIKESESKVPLLGDIPVIGWLFKSVSHIKEKSNLTLFITPHVVRDANDLSKIYEEKIKDRDNYLRAFYGKNFKEEGFYAQYPKLEDGKARPERDSREDGSDKAEKNSEFLEQRRKVLPSEESNPINAPTATSGGGGGAGMYSPPVGSPVQIPSAPSLPAQ